MELTNIQFLKIKDKLCHAVPYCNKCPIMKLGKEKGEDSCTALFRMYPEEVVDIVSKWADDHANYMSDFRDKFPNATLQLSLNIWILYQWFVEDIFTAQELMDVCLMRVLATSVGKSSTFKPRLEN